MIHIRVDVLVFAFKMEKKAKHRKKQKEKRSFPQNLSSFCHASQRTGEVSHISLSELLMNR